MLQHSSELFAEWQKRCIIQAEHEEKFICYAKAGEGKTRTALAIAAIRHCKTIIVICRRAAFYDWRNEIANTQILGANPLIIELDGKNANNPSMWILAQAILISCDMLADLIKKIHPSFLEDCFLIVDELYLFGNYKSQRSKALNMLTRYIDNVVGLSATIMPAKDNTSIYSQLYALNMHRTLASGITKWRERFQESIFSPFGMMGKQFVNKVGSSKQIIFELGQSVFLHFPENNERQIHQKTVTVPLTPNQTRLCQEIKRDYFTKFGNEEIDTTNVLQNIHIMCGISNGWIVSSDKKLHSFPSPKVDATKAIVEELLAANERCIVWCHYRNDIKRLVDAFHTIPHLTFSGGSDFDTENWERPDGPKLVLATEASGASVNHFAQVPYAIYFSMDAKWVHLQQSMGRTDRRSSFHKNCHYTFVKSQKPSVDEDIMMAAQNSKTEEEMLLNIWTNWQGETK